MASRSNEKEKPPAITGTELPLSCSRYESRLSESEAWSPRKSNLKYLGLLLAAFFLSINLFQDSVSNIWQGSRNGDQPSVKVLASPFEALQPKRKGLKHGEFFWEPCARKGLEKTPLEGTECGYVAVPKDYADSSAGLTYLAIAKLPAKTKPKQPRSNGMILLNPGGPGGSGADLVLYRGDMLRSLLGDTYDLVGFDPRGIGATIPQTCVIQRSDPFTPFVIQSISLPPIPRLFNFSSSTQPQDLEFARQHFIHAQNEANAMYEMALRSCGEEMGDELKYMGTALVARDVEFMTRVLTENEDALINFFGGSYGTILGQYLVNMFPDRLGRVNIDGNANVELWTGGPPYKSHRQWLINSEASMKEFFNLCSRAGPNECPLSQEMGESPESIDARLESFFEALWERPLAVVGPSSGYITEGAARIVFFRMFQRPMRWKELSQRFSKAMNGDPSELFEEVLLSDGQLQNFLPRHAVSCADMPNSKVSPEDMADEAISTLKSVSRFAVTVKFTETDEGCQYFPVKPVEKFLGPWNHTLNNPILITANARDPVTPLDSGVRVNQLLGLENSRLLIQNSSGHCSTSVPSLCTAKNVRTYFSEGTLPDNGLQCEVDFNPFSDFNARRTIRTEEEEKTLRDLVNLARWI